TLAHPFLDALDVQLKALVLARRDRVVITDVLDVATVALAALIGHDDMVERQNCRISGRHTRVVRGKRGILAGFHQNGRGEHAEASRYCAWLLAPDPAQRIGGNPPIPPMPFMAPRICRSRPLLPPLPSLDIIFSICMYCFRTRLTSAGWVPEPRATRA